MTPKKKKVSASEPGWVLAWEFLRRNPDYRAEWEEVVDRCRILPEGALCVAGPDEPRPTVGEPVPEGRAADPAFHISSNEARERWLLDDGYLNPDTDRPRHLRFALTFGGSVFGTPRSSVLRGRWTGYFPIDFSLPLEPQVSRLKDEYRHLRPRLKALGMRSSRPTVHRKKLARYLQALDLEEEDGRWGATEELVPRRKTGAARKKAGDDLLRQARRMTQPEGYAALLLS